MISDTLKHYQELLFSDLAAVQSTHDLETFRVKHLSRNGLLSALMDTLKTLSLEDKKKYGPAFNELRKKAQDAFQEKEEALEKERLKELEQEYALFDVTAYKTPRFTGSLHPHTHIIEKAEDILISMGFEMVQGPEVDTDFYNFEALNIPKDHPARDMQDTFWLTIPGLLLRTHTSSVEIHVMTKRKPPFAIAAAGRTFRNEATDASHDFMFLQLEGLFIDKNVSLANLLAVMKEFLAQFFQKKELKIQIRPSYFPFVEPGVEIDMSCPFCTRGCAPCKRSGWIEIGGAGLTHPNVLTACGIDPKEYSGFAFGLGLTRLVMLKYGITDIRLLHSNKIEFLEQF